MPEITPGTASDFTNLPKSTQDQLVDDYNHKKQTDQVTGLLGAGGLLVGGGLSAYAIYSLLEKARRNKARQTMATNTAKRTKQVVNENLGKQAGAMDAVDTITSIPAPYIYGGAGLGLLGVGGAKFKSLLDEMAELEPDKISKRKDRHAKAKAEFEALLAMERQLGKQSEAIKAADSFISQFEDNYTKSETTEKRAGLIEDVYIPALIATFGISGAGAYLKSRSVDKNRLELQAARKAFKRKAMLRQPRLYVIEGDSQLDNLDNVGKNVVPIDLDKPDKDDLKKKREVEDKLDLFQKLSAEFIAVCEIENLDHVKVAECYNQLSDWDKGFLLRSSLSEYLQIEKQASGQPEYDYSGISNNDERTALQLLAMTRHPDIRPEYREAVVKQLTSMVNSDPTIAGVINNQLGFTVGNDMSTDQTNQLIDLAMQVGIDPSQVDFSQAGLAHSDTPADGGWLNTAAKGLDWVAEGLTSIIPTPVSGDLPEGRVPNLAKTDEEIAQMANQAVQDQITQGDTNMVRAGLMSGLNNFRADNKHTYDEAIAAIQNDPNDVEGFNAGLVRGGAIDKYGQGLGGIINHLRGMNPYQWMGLLGGLAPLLFGQGMGMKGLGTAAILASLFWPQIQQRLGFGPEQQQEQQPPDTNETNEQPQEPPAPELEQGLDSLDPGYEAKPQPTAEPAPLPTTNFSDGLDEQSSVPVTNNAGSKAAPKGFDNNPHTSAVKQAPATIAPAATRQPAPVKPLSLPKPQLPTPQQPPTNFQLGEKLTFNKASNETIRNIGELISNTAGSSIGDTAVNVWNQVRRPAPAPQPTRNVATAASGLRRVQPTSTTQSLANRAFPRDEFAGKQKYSITQNNPAQALQGQGIKPFQYSTGGLQFGNAESNSTKES